MQLHFDRVICGLEEPKPTSDVERNMKYGTEHEIDATATLVAKVLPVLHPNLQFNEEGCIAIPNSKEPFLIVSPDGSLSMKTNIDEIKYVAAVEIKCPVFKVHSKFPCRYVLQCLSEMEALNVEECLYISWRPDVTTVFKLHRSSDVYESAMKLAGTIYGQSKPRRPTKIPDETKTLKAEIDRISNNVQFLGRFESIHSSSTNQNSIEDKNLAKTVSLEMLSKLYEDIAEVTKVTYELKRQKATEALVFLCCDFDRIWSKKEIIWSPICWCTKGYSLTTDVMRNIMEAVLDQCNINDIHVPASSFDGQWHNICVRSKAGRPLTLYQLHKDVWKEVQKMTKGSIEKELKSIIVKPISYCKVVSKKENHYLIEGKVIVCTNGGLKVPQTPSHGWPQSSSSARNKEKKANADEVDNELSVIDAVPNSIIPSNEDNNKEYLSLFTESHDDRKVQEIDSCNVSDDKWMTSITNIIDSCDDVIVASSSTSANPEDVHDKSIFMPDGNSNGNKCSQASGFQITNQVAMEILAMLQTDNSSNKKGQWKNKDITDVIIMLSCWNTLKEARDCELRIVVRYLKRNTKYVIKEFVSKLKKNDAIISVLGITETTDDTYVHRKSQCKLKQPKSLQMLSSLALKRVPKAVLNVAYAHYIWPKRRDEWFRCSTVVQDSMVYGQNYPLFWFYQPEYSDSRHQLEVRCIDSTHLLTRCRRKTCNGGIEGLSNHPWTKVAKQGQTFLTPVMVSDIVDPMSMSMAVTHFSESVQYAMRQNGDIHAASLCADVHNWWRSEDEPGISAVERIQLRKKLRERLLLAMDFDRFPTPSMHIQGWPVQLWEALVANIDAKALLYSLCRNGTYNTRAFSSIMGETFFAELTHQDHSGHGTVSANEFGRFIGKTIDQMQVRLDPDRAFHYRTSKCKAYRLVQAHKESKPHYQAVNNSNLRRIDTIIPRDHPFDTEERRRCKGKRRMGTVSTKRNSLQKGTLGVRWETARRNEGKMLLSKKWELNNYLSKINCMYSIKL